MAPISREERVLNLLSALLAARAPVSTAEIRERVSGYDDAPSADAVEKRLDRDKGLLRSLGIPLEFVAEDEFGRSGYRIAKERYFLDEIRFTVEEGIALAAIQETALAGGRDAFAAALRSALAKISVDSPLSEAFRESVTEQQLLDARLPSGEREDPGHLAVLGEALAARRPVRFTYYTLGSGEEAVRTVEPWGIGYYRGHWYLVGKDVGKGEERQYRTSRIRGAVTALDPSGYEIPEDFDLKAEIGRSPWEIGGAEPIRARIRFAPEVAWMIAENVRPGQSFCSRKSGAGVLTLEAKDPAALVRWVAQYGPAAEILGPEELRGLMREHLAGIVERSES